MLVFQICFFSGLVLLGLSFLFGQFFDFLDMDGLGLDGLHMDGFDLNSIFPLSPTMILLFITLFGGIGGLLVSLNVKLNVLIVGMIAIIIAFLICVLITRGFIIPLKKAQNTSAANQEELIGLQATVSETIQANKFGEIRYTIHGNSYTAPAKSVNSEEISKEEQVSICWIEDHVFYVTHITI